MSEHCEPKLSGKGKVVRRGREQRRRVRTATPVVHLPALVHETPLYEILDSEGVELIPTRQTTANIIW